MKRARYLTIKVGFIAPFHARIFTPGEGSQEMEPRIETDLVSLAEVRGFLVVVRPDAYIEE